MEVTKSNFKNILPELEKAIKDCTFVSIDTELTGLKLASNRIGAYDTPKQYYEKLLTDCRQFLVVQYGVSVFRYVEKENVFKHQSYNFYTFRRPENRYVQDQRFLCQTSSIDFLIKNNFDFNKVFKEGISYMNDQEEDKCKEFLTEHLKRRLEAVDSDTKNDISENITVPENCREFVDDNVKKLETFLESSDAEVKLPICNGFMRRLIYEMTAAKFSDKISLETRQVENDRILFATRLKSKKERKEGELLKHEDSLKQLDDFIGFSKVIRLIVESEKPVIGHNLMYDFMHTIDKFLTPLPEDYQDFKECASSLFKSVLDTKILSTSEPFKGLIKSSVLKDVLDTLNESPFGIPKTEIEEGKESYSLSDVKEHEAGFDSYITGLCFMALWKYLGTDRKWPDADTFGPLGKKLLSPYVNKIFLMYLTDNQYVNLNGNDITPGRNHVFYLTFPREWKTENIIQLFSPFGPVNVAWISENTAYVALYKKEQAGLALKTLSKGEKYTITPFVKRQALLAGIRTPLPSPIKRRKSSEQLKTSSEGPTKRRKTNSFDGIGISASKRSIDPIEEEENESSSSLDEGNTSTATSSPTNDDTTSESFKAVRNHSKKYEKTPQKNKKSVFDECQAWD